MAHDQEIMGSNPGTVYWMDVSNASYYIIEKLKIKVAKWGTPKNFFFLNKVKKDNSYKSQFIPLYHKNNLFSDLSTYYRSLYNLSSPSVVSCASQVLNSQRKGQVSRVSNAFRLTKVTY
jgi:hypothetical protein